MLQPCLRPSPLALNNFHRLRACEYWRLSTPEIQGPRWQLPDHPWSSSAANNSPHTTVYTPSVQLVNNLAIIHKPCTPIGGLRRTARPLHARKVAPSHQ